MSTTTTMQILAAFVNLSGSRDNVVYRGGADGITLAEAYVLMALHGGEENVFDLIVEHTIERDMETEYDRLRLLYGDVVEKVFPKIAGRVVLPMADDKLPTRAEADAAQAAALQVKAKAREKRTTARVPAAAAASAPETPDASALPGLDALPN